MFKWKKKAEMQNDRQLKTIYIDNVNELKSYAFKWAEESDINYQPTVLYTLS